MVLPPPPPEELATDAIMCVQDLSVSGDVCSNWALCYEVCVTYLCREGRNIGICLTGNGFTGNNTQRNYCCLSTPRQYRIRERL